MIRATTRLKTILALLPVFAVPTLCACGSDRSTVVLVPGEEGASGSFADESGYLGDGWANDEAADAGPPPEPFSMPFAGMFGQQVQWAALRVSVLDARIERGMDAEQESTDEWGFHTYLEPADIYVELDVEIHSEDKDIVDYSTRATWDLVLADGTRVMSANALGLMISRGDTATTTLRYVVDDVVDLAGASLELNGEERADREPERIPLDAAYVRRYPQLLTEAVGKVIEPTVRNDRGDLLGVRFEVLDAVYDVNDPVIGARVPVDQRIVRMDVVATGVGDHAKVDDDDFLIVVDGRSYAVADGVPVEFLDAGLSANFHVVFTVDPTARRFEVVFRTWNTESQQRIAIDLDNAVLVDE